MTTQTASVHDRMAPVRRILRFLMDNVAFRFLAKIDSVEGLENIPTEGGGIIYMNHTSLIDSVTVVKSVQRNVVPVARFDFGNVPIWGIFPKLWGAIPIKRGAVDRGALEQAVQVLKSGELLLYLPEGTRRPAMGRAKDGMAYLAAQTGVPVIPAAVHGVEGFPSLSPKRWAKPGAQIRFGQPFCFQLPDGKVTREWLRKMTDEAMYRLAALLPPERRGVYADLESATSETIKQNCP
ncbi:MAG: 1-acyl-sn-glycerol-3-phosphate acyltransferase [Anaerolineales bacterium]|nr:1-acyl-sn-glycerol-3-phosphate acyltransferase [Anaerolineales bacterium]